MVCHFSFQATSFSIPVKILSFNGSGMRAHFVQHLKIMSVNLSVCCINVKDLH
uniref:Uncharacterized protein n=1 Tax=Anguilla anguilla TaxID=7936 RepID=A0A0E9S9V1_ANGAN